MAVTIAPTPAIDGRAQVERIIQSKIFRASEVLRNLLAYLSDKALSGTADNLKEYTIGLDALGKPASFDPRQESVVRMHTARLRQKLAEYYRTEGVDDPIIIDLPKGGFKITFEPRQQAVQPAPAAPIVEIKTSRRGWHPREIALAAALAVTLACALYFMTRLWRVERTESGGASVSSEIWTPALRELWEPLLSSSRRLVVCVATPLFVKVPGFGVVRESSINDWQDVPDSKRLTSLESALRIGISEPSYSYTEVGTATGAFLLGQFLAPRKQAVLITRANVLSWPEIAEDNVVFLGPPTGIHQTDDIPMGAQLVLDPTGIRNLKPRAGEEAFIKDRPSQGGEEAGVSYALISRVPAMEGPGAILMLSGNQISSVMGGVKAFTNPALAQMLVSRLKAGSGTIPRFFQVVLSVKAMDDVPVEISYMFHRELPERGQRSPAK
ncbi:MAG: hypothetical protein ABSG41_04040 [Bryobacteraceae bacterium]|jgi:hypothetical protein